MKKLILGLLALGSLSAQATIAYECNYIYTEYGVDGHSTSENGQVSLAVGNTDYLHLPKSGKVITLELEKMPKIPDMVFVNLLLQTPHSPNNDGGLTATVSSAHPYFSVSASSGKRSQNLSCQKIK